MSRCDHPAFLLSSLAPRLAAMAVLAVTTVMAPAAQAQIAPGHRFFPVQALRGELVIGASPEATLNGKAARLAPGSRIRGADNMLAMPGALVGQKLVVHYTRDFSGLLMDVWVLNPVELANKTWPRTEQEAAKWRFDGALQVWIKP